MLLEGNPKNRRNKTVFIYGIIGTKFMSHKIHLNLELLYKKLVY